MGTDVSKQKRAYASPKLNTYGSVRNLTGGSGGSSNDTTNMSYMTGFAMF